MLLPIASICVGSIARRMARCNKPPFTRLSARYVDTYIIVGDQCARPCSHYFDACVPREIGSLSERIFRGRGCMWWQCYATCGPPVAWRHAWLEESQGASKMLAAAARVPLSAEHIIPQADQLIRAGAAWSRKGGSRLDSQYYPWPWPWPLLMVLGHGP